jgi:hypothetical protein
MKENFKQKTMKNLSKSMLAVLSLCLIMAACGKSKEATDGQDSVKTETPAADTTTTATDTTAVKADTTAAK